MHLNAMHCVLDQLFRLAGEEGFIAHRKTARQHSNGIMLLLLKRSVHMSCGVGVGRTAFQKVNIFPYCIHIDIEYKSINP